MDPLNWVVFNLPDDVTETLFKENSEWVRFYPILGALSAFGSVGLGVLPSYIIFVIFSPHKKRVNRDKTDFTVKQRKPLQLIWQQNRVDFNFLHLSCGEIINFSTIVKISQFSTSVMWRNLKFRYIYQISPHLPCIEI